MLKRRDSTCIPALSSALWYCAGESIKGRSQRRSQSEQQAVESHGDSRPQAPFAIMNAKDQPSARVQAPHSSVAAMPVAHRQDKYCSTSKIRIKPADGISNCRTSATLTSAFSAAQSLAGNVAIRCAFKSHPDQAPVCCRRRPQNREPCHSRNPDPPPFPSPVLQSASKPKIRSSLSFQRTNPRSNLGLAANV